MSAALQTSVIEGLLQTENYALSKQLLDVADLRHRALTANLANVETPGYKRVDLPADFAQQLQKTVDSGKIDLRQMNLRLVEDGSAAAVRPDGNNVTLDQEMLEINRNALEYQFLTEYVSSSITRLRTAITGRP